RATAGTDANRAGRSRHFTTGSLAFERLSRPTPGGASLSSLLIDADNQMAFVHLVARNAQGIGGIELTQHERIAVPADKLLDQHGCTFFVDDHIAAARRRLEGVYVEQPTLLVAWLHAVADHVYCISRADAPQVGGTRRKPDRAVFKKHLLIDTAPSGTANRDEVRPADRS